MMKFKFFLSSFLLLCFACGSNLTTDESSDQAASLLSNNAQIVKGNLPERKEACEFFSVDDMAGFLNWKSGDVSNELMMSLKKYSTTVCDYMNSEREHISLRVSWKSEKGQQNKVLKHQYEKYKTQGEKGLTYTKTNCDQGSESLFGVGANRNDKTIYILRTRYENQAEVVIEGAFENNDPAAFEATFKRILSEI